MLARLGADQRNANAARLRLQKSNTSRTHLVAFAWISKPNRWSSHQRSQQLLLFCLFSGLSKVSKLANFGQIMPRLWAARQWLSAASQWAKERNEKAWRCTFLSVSTGKPLNSKRFQRTCRTKLRSWRRSLIRNPLLGCAPKHLLVFFTRRTEPHAVSPRAKKFQTGCGWALPCLSKASLQRRDVGRGTPLVWAASVRKRFFSQATNVVSPCFGDRLLVGLKEKSKDAIHLEGCSPPPVSARFFWLALKRWCLVCLQVPCFCE